MKALKNRDYSGAEKLQAFVLYLEKGEIEHVKRRYPQHVPFVETNAHKSYQEVKDMCLGLVFTYKH